MKRFAALLVAGLIVVGSTLAHGSASAAATADKPSARRYIVTLKADANPRSVAAVAGVAPLFVYDAALNGFAATLNQGQINALRRHASVVAIEPDSAVVLDSAIAGDEAAQAPTTSNVGINAASNVTSYVVDTGIYMAHSEFGGRAALGYDAFGGTGNDCNGQGTHTAGIIGGARYGVAKDVKLRAVRVFDCNGSGSWSGVIAGINWIANNGVKPAVATLGFGGPANSSVDTAVSSLVNRGIPVVVPAGNSNSDACAYSPARVPSAITVGAVNGTIKAPYSNFGSCVDVYAPGTRTAAWIGGTTSLNTLSGTRVAAAYVSGCIALYLGGNPTATPPQVYNWVIANAPITGTIRIFTCPF